MRKTSWALLLFVMSAVSPERATAGEKVLSGNINAQQATKITQDYSAEYDVTRRGRTHGNAGRMLRQQADGTWVYNTFTSASILFFSDHRSHETNFKLSGGQVVPLSFEYERTGTGSSKFLNVTFDYDRKALITTTGEPVGAKWHENLLDSNAVLHQLQIDLAASAYNNTTEWTYQLIDEDGRHVEYTFRMVEQETIRVPYGVLDTMKVMRVRETNRRETYFWFSPLHQYTLVQMQQIKEGKEQAKLVLRSLQ